jgi:hypothetical protein
MNISPGMREAIGIGAGAVLGLVTAGGALAALTAEDAGARRTGLAVAGTALLTAAGTGALLLRSPATRPDAIRGALAFVAMPSLIATGVIQNHRDL